MPRKQRKRVSKNCPAKGVLRDKADRLWSKAVRAEWDWKCAVCGARKCEAHHLIPREKQATRYDLRNGIALCFTHHRTDPNISPHQNSAGWLLWLKSHHRELHDWYLDTVAAHKEFDGTTNATFYCDMILTLKPLVAKEDYIKIVGKKFGAWLETQECEAEEE